MASGVRVKEAVVVVQPYLYNCFLYVATRFILREKRVMIMHCWYTGYQDMLQGLVRGFAQSSFTAATLATARTESLAGEFDRIVVASFRFLVYP